MRGLIAFGIGLALTSGALAVLHHADPSPGRAAEVSVLVAANLLATIIRFGLYRSWVFRGGARGPADLPELVPGGPGSGPARAA